ncbi:MAG: hypothetical protein KQA41_01260 [Candidatus Aenigmarchaeota archaeon]|nr:hypothetical protein [Candidatus Aenigmarchaeota archaeon]
MDEIIQIAEIVVENYIMKQIISCFKCNCPKCLRDAKNYFDFFTFGKGDQKTFDYLYRLVRSGLYRNNNTIF